MTDSSSYTVDDMRAGAEVAVKICMAVQPGERVLILGDESSALISQALAEAADSVAEQVETRTLEQVGVRPITSMPDPLQGLLEQFQPHVSFYTASSRPGELKFRMAYMPAVMQANPEGARHGHMINITPPLMMQGMRVDYQQIYDVTMRVNEIVRSAAEIRVTNPKGTDFAATFNPEFNWIPCHGLYHEPGKWGNLPEGETFTSPQDANGVLVVDELATISASDMESSPRRSLSKLRRDAWARLAAKTGHWRRTCALISMAPKTPIEWENLPSAPTSR